MQHVYRVAGGCVVYAALRETIGQAGDCVGRLSLAQGVDKGREGNLAFADHHIVAVGKRLFRHERDMRASHDHDLALAFQETRQTIGIADGTAERAYADDVVRKESFFPVSRQGLKPDVACMAMFLEECSQRRDTDTGKIGPAEYMR